MRLLVTVYSPSTLSPESAMNWLHRVVVALDTSDGTVVQGDRTYGAAAKQAVEDQREANRQCEQTLVEISASLPVSQQACYALWT